MSYGPPPPPPGAGAPRKKPWFAILVAVTGICIFCTGAALGMAVTLGMLFWQLLANVVMIVFVQDLRWYGPGVFDAGQDLWTWVIVLCLIGSAVMGLAGLLLGRTGTPFPSPKRRRRTGS